MSFQEINIDSRTVPFILSQDVERVTNRSLYFHIPFCQDICSFCPFTREILQDEEYLNRYVNALINEIQLKAQYTYVSRKPITSIFFGGGTPSIMKPNHIRKIGQAIKDNFDISELKEFSFEMNAKTITIDRIAALKDIGVTHGRMGVQTFNPEYRDMFKLTASMENIYNGAKLLNENFDYVCIDMLYGMHGQKLGDVIKDLKQARQLGTSHMDVYPINNGVIQKRLQDEYTKKHYTATDGLNKYLFNVAIYEYLARNGFRPHNGHGYYRCPSRNGLGDFVDDKYTFQYHESVYGYAGHEIIAFGPVGYSVLNEYVISNQANINNYIESLERGEFPIAGIGVYPRTLTEIKGMVLHLPYHGVAYKENINFNYIDDEMMDKIEQLTNAELLIEYDDRFALTKTGWYNYVNLLYYLSPKCEQDALMRYVRNANVYDEYICNLEF